MAMLPHSTMAFLFQTGIERIEVAYHASVATMQGAYAEAATAYTDYESSGQDDDEYDEDNILTKSTRVALNFETLNAAVAVEVVREAFITSAFHYWERSARGWTNLHDFRDNFPVLKKATAKLYSLHPDLAALNALNNRLKHSGAGKNALPHPRLNLPVTDDAVALAFELVKASGPIY